MSARSAAALGAGALALLVAFAPASGGRAEVQDAPAGGSGAAAAGAAGGAARDGAAATEPRLLDAEHPLAGRIWDVRAGRFVGAAALEARIAGARWVLLGERHGHPEHHRLQARLLGAVAAGGARALVVEQLEFAQQSAVDRCAAECPDFGAELGARVDWARSGWPDYSLYAPVFAAAARHGYAVHAGNPGAARIRALAREPATPPLDPAEREWRSAAAAPLAADGRAALEQDLVDGHCGMLPRERTGPLVAAQRLRDAALAATLERVGGDAGAVLVAGNGHVRRDYGVPTLLPAAATLAIGLFEVRPARLEPRDYPALAAFDLVVFTARVDEPDPCERFREQLQRLAPREP